jgi:hypothetical protein
MSSVNTLKDYCICWFFHSSLWGIGLTSVQCIVWLRITDQHYALSYITPLFDRQAPTCFDIHVPSSGNFLCPRELFESRNVYVVCLVLWMLVACVHWLLWVRVLCCPAERSTTSAHRSPAFTVYDKQHNQSCLRVTHKDIGSSLKMAHGCRNM